MKTPITRILAWLVLFAGATMFTGLTCHLLTATSIMASTSVQPASIPFTGPASTSSFETAAPLLLSPLTPKSLRPSGATYYIRPDGGSSEQCTGLADAPYPGSGTNQACAWDHPFQALPPDGTPRIAGGDTLIIEAGSYKMGYGALGDDNCDYEGSYGCHMPPIPSGPDASHPTRLLGAGWDTGCASPPELWGSGRPWFIINLTDSSNVDVACLEITDHSSCIEDHVFTAGGSPYTCQRETPPYGDWAATGLYAEDSTNVHLLDLNIHGLANNGVLAGRLTDWTVVNVRIIGNGLAGWNGDIDGEDANTGTLSFHHWEVDWNGCGETFPDEQHIGCWGQEAGGYGDGVGTGTTGGHWIIEDSAFLNNTSDGLDLLYARVPNSIIEIRRTIAAGNDGNQIKITTDQAIIENTVVVSNCGAFHGMPYWNNDDDCRAGGDALALALQPSGQITVVNSTITGEGGCLAIAECALDQTCNGSEKVLLRNNLFQGQKIFFNPEEDTCFAWYDDESNPPMPANPFVVDYSLITSVRFGNVNPCPGPNNLCDVDAGLVSIDIDDFDAHLQAGSSAINAGTTDGAPGVDITGRARDANPDIGAYEWWQSSGGVYLPLLLREPLTACTDSEYSASTERIGVMRSTDGGKSWEFLGHACFHAPTLAPVDISPIFIDQSLALYFVDIMSFGSGKDRPVYRAFTSDGVLFTPPVPVYSSTTQQFTDPYVLKMQSGECIMYLSDIVGIRVTVSADQGTTFTSTGMVSIGLSVPGALQLPNGNVRLFGGAPPTGSDIYGATSPDGLSNFILDAQPAIKRNGADMVNDAHPISLRSGGYLMSYKVRPSGATDDPTQDLVYLASSPDSYTWTAGTSPIVKGSVPSIIELADGTLLLYYVDFNY